MAIWTLLRDAVYLLAFASAAYSIVAIVAAHKFFGRARAVPEAGGAGEPPASEFTPPVSILKPIRGLDRETYENYASFCRQDYPEFEILFCVTDETDPAVPVIEQVIHDFSGRDFPERSIRLLIGSEPLGASDKVNKLCRMVREARHEIIIVTDSDVRVEAGFLRAVAAPFRDPAVGGVTCLYRGRTDGSFPANLEALGNSTDFAPGVLVAWMLGGGKLDFMLGAVMATTKTFLSEIGGFESLVDYFCDDYELGNRLAARGHRIELSRFPVDIVYPRESLPEAFRHQLRWNLSIRYSRPWGHLGLMFTQILVWSLVGLFVTQSWLGEIGFAALYSLLRHEVALSAGARGMKDKLVRQKMWLLATRDLFAFVVWLASFFPQRIYWRDRQFYVRNKRLIPSD
jgi:ceramide glucosyltransferase